MLLKYSYFLSLSSSSSWRLLSPTAHVRLPHAALLQQSYSWVINRRKPTPHYTTSEPSPAFTSLFSLLLSDKSESQTLLYWPPPRELKIIINNTQLEDWIAKWIFRGLFKSIPLFHCVWLVSLVVMAEWEPFPTHSQSMFHHISNILPWHESGRH